jgi:Na+/proline symporter
MLDPIPTTLDENVGWFTVLGFGFAFTLLTMGITNLEGSLLGKGEKTSEEFATAGRNLGMGLVAADIVSQWTWAATLLMSSNMCWKVGISGSYWYAAGASVQIMLFAILATQVKRRAPNMRTFMELVRVRWGKAAHITFICFALTTNVIVSAMLILGGAATLTALTGMPTHAAAFLVPIVACLPYTLMGGLRATFLAHYFNTFFIFIALFIFMFYGYLSDYVGSGTEFYGSPDLVLASLDKASEHAVMNHVDWDPDAESPETDAAKYGMQGFSAYIQNAGLCYDKDEKVTDKTCWYRPRASIDDFCHEKCETNPLDVQACGNLEKGCITTSEKEHWEQAECDGKKGEKCVPSLATMDSTSGLKFGIINIVGNFGTVFVDQSYWQSAIAVKPESAASGYILGGVVWFAVPMMMGTTHGLVGRAFTTNSELKNGASHITANDSGAGLTPARVAVEILGEPGAWILLIMLFMAIVSTGCAEIIAVATIMTYDVYCEYLNWDLKTERMNNRQIYYATVIGKNADLGVSKARAPREMIKVNEIAIKSVEKLKWQDELEGTLKKLAEANLLPSTREFTAEERTDIEKTLVGYADTDGLVTYEMLYFAVQSQVLCKLSGEAGIVLRMMKFFCICFAVFMGFLANFLQSLLAPYGRGLGFVYCSMGIFVGPAVAPAAMAILMESASPKWCTIGAISGLVFGIITWLATAQYMYEEVTIATLDNDDPFLYSNLVSMCFSALVAIAGSLADPNKDFQWSHLSVQLPLVDDMPPKIEEGRNAEQLDELLQKSYKKSVGMAMFLFIFLCALFPGVLYGGAFIFGSQGFTIWVVIFMLWCFIGGLAVIILPLYDFKKDYDANQKLKKQLETKAI